MSRYSSSDNEMSNTDSDEEMPSLENNVPIYYTEDQITELYESGMLNVPHIESMGDVDFRDRSSNGGYIVKLVNMSYCEVFDLLLNVSGKLKMHSFIDSLSGNTAFIGKANGVKWFIFSGMKDEEKQLKAALWFAYMLFSDDIENDDIKLQFATALMVVNNPNDIEEYKKDCDISKQNIVNLPQSLSFYTGSDPYYINDNIPKCVSRFITYDDPIGKIMELLEDFDMYKIFE